jgi:uncharacterized glyoxalase superfamily protein PhnB
MSTNASPRAAGAADTLRTGTLSLSLTVKEIQKSLAWYRDVVGFTVVRTREQDGQLRAVTLAAGDVRLGLNQDDGKRGWTRVKGEGFSLNITIAQDVDALAAGIKARGGSLATEPADMAWGVRMFRLLDPDGYKIGISKPLAG